MRLAVDSAAEPGTGTGLGVLSMRERAESLGGTCPAGPGGRGWLVRAALPLGRQPAAGGRDMIRVLLVDDQELVRTGLRGILRAGSASTSSASAPTAAR